MNERITERDLMLPALKFIQEYKGLSTTELIKLLDNALKPIGEDVEILSGRKDTKFSQKVRNLVGSHYETNNMNVYTKRIGEKLVLTKEGEKLLAENKHNIETIIKSEFNDDDMAEILKTISKTISSEKKVVVYDENDTIAEGALYKKQSDIRQRSQKLRSAAIEYYTAPDGSLKCAVCGFDFGKVYHELGKGFIEMHHEHPIYQISSDGEEKFISEAIKDIKPVCANCHRMIHRNRKNPLSIEELKKIIKD